MMKIVATLVAALAAFTLPLTAAEPAAKTTSAEIPVKGMVCMACVAKVNRTLKSLDGVAKASADLAKRKVSVDYNPEKITEEQVIESIRKLGYEPEKPKPEKPKRQEVE